MDLKFLADSPATVHDTIIHRPVVRQQVLLGTDLGSEQQIIALGVAVRQPLWLPLRTGCTVVSKINPIVRHYVSQTQIHGRGLIAQGMNVIENIRYFGGVLRPQLLRHGSRWPMREKIEKCRLSNIARQTAQPPCRGPHAGFRAQMKRAAVCLTCVYSKLRTMIFPSHAVCRHLVRPLRLPPRQALSCLMLLCASTLASAQSTEPESPAEIQVCVQQQVLRPEHRSRSVSDLYILCEQQLSSDSNNAAITATPELNRFFRPYKDNYLVFGQARTADGSTPFSGEQLDIKFELGLTFNLFEQITNLSFLAPLGFGYSQRSWWNVGEDSAPFAEHNYNPEVFWKFDQPYSSFAGKFPFIDIIGIEHQSNGLQGPGSRSWDRAYIQKEFDLLPRFSVDVKLWNVLGVEANNQDITDYLGQGQVTLKFEPNERTRIRLRIIKGLEVEKYSYQLDLSYRRPWVNSGFFISYYEGYGEALISFNQKTRSLRAGLYFPLEVLSR